MPMQEMIPYAGCAKQRPPLKLNRVDGQRQLLRSNKCIRLQYGHLVPFWDFIRGVSKRVRVGVAKCAKFISVRVAWAIQDF